MVRAGTRAGARDEAEFEFEFGLEFGLEFGEWITWRIGQFKMRLIIGLGVKLEYRNAD